jgi:ribose transport system substrate-binding protein
VSQARQPVTSYTLPQGDLSAVTDKHIVAITCTNQGSGCIQSAQAAAAAVKSFGWTMTIVDGKGDPNVWNSAILNAITDHADAILLSAVPTALVSGAMAKAKAAGIPIVTMFTPVLPDGAFGHVTVDHTLQGKQMADWVIADSNGKAHVIVNTDTEWRGSRPSSGSAAAARSWRRSPRRLPPW